MAQWWSAFSDAKVTVAEVIDSACEQDTISYGGNAKFVRGAFRGAVLAAAGRGGAVNAKALGHWLKGHKDRIVGDVRLEQVGSRQNVSLWRLVKDY